MQCSQCRFENRHDARFCLKCGAQLSLTCAECSTALPPEAAFCDTCGVQVCAPSGVDKEAGLTPLERALQRFVPEPYVERLLASRGQVPSGRRTVTILFSDVAGSTALAGTMDPEDWTEVMGGAFEVLIEPIYRYEGTLARLMGDAILAFFGAPFTHEDDAQRACLAALEIVRGTRRYAAQLQEQRGISGFDVRVGIHTGLVVVGPVGSDLRVEYTAMGDAANLAARMESAAEPGTVLVSEATHRLVAPLFETVAMGPVTVKGKSDPVRVYRILEAKAAPGKARGIVGLALPLVGREIECATLSEALVHLRAGVGGIVTIAGEAGIGKSRLVAELRKAAMALEPRPQWVEGRCLSYGSSVAYLLWLDVLRALLGVPVDGPQAQVRDALRDRVQALCPDQVDEVYPYLGQVMSLPLEENAEATVQGLEGDQIKANTFQAVETFLVAAASEGPLVLVGEDLHWADPTSIELLERILALTDRVPVLVMCLMRPEREHGCWRVREIANRQFHHRHIDLWLDPLSIAESEALVANLLGIKDLPRELKERVQSHTEGNPFYVEEVIRSLIDRGAIVQDSATGRWQATEDLARLPIPDTLQGVLMARIDRLDEEAKRVLQMAAVIGRIFLYRILVAIAQETRELDRDLVTLQREEMIRERARLPEMEYIFKHELTREAAYNGLLRKERAAFHRRVAEALEQQFPERIEEQMALLAHHWERAGDPKKAASYLLRAGDQARQAFAHEEAIDFYQRALVFLKELEDHERTARTLMKLGLTYHTALDFQASRRAYQEGFGLWQRATQVVSTRPPPPAPHALREVLVEPVTLDPTRALDLHSSSLIDQLVSGLVELSPNLEVMPSVAHSWEVKERGRQYVFHLRDDVVWSDGMPVTAADFEFAWKRSLEPAGGSPVAILLYEIEGARDYHKGVLSDPGGVGVQALDATTLLVSLKEPVGYFLHLLTHVLCGPVPRHAVETHGDSWTDEGKFVSNGPFCLETWCRGESMTLVRNPNYHGQRTGNVERVELSFLGGAPGTWERYEAGALDVVFMTFFPPDDLDRARRRHAEEYVAIPGAMTEFVGFHTERPPFDDPRVRQAFAHATDKERLADVTLRGFSPPATGGLVPPRVPGHSQGIGLGYDPARARELLAEAGFPGGGGFPVVDLPVSPEASTEEAREELRRQWRDCLGIEVAGETMPWAAYVETLGEGSDMYLTGVGGGFNDPDLFLRIVPRLLWAGWHNERYDGLVEKAKGAMDQDARIRLYQEADRLLMEESPVIPLIYLRIHLLVKPWVTRYQMSPMYTWYWKDVVIEPH